MIGHNRLLAIPLAKAVVDVVVHVVADVAHEQDVRHVGIERHAELVCGRGLNGRETILDLGVICGGLPGDNRARCGNTRKFLTHILIGSHGAHDAREHQDHEASRDSNVLSRHNVATRRTRTQLAATRRDPATEPEDVQDDKHHEQIEAAVLNAARAHRSLRPERGREARGKQRGRTGGDKCGHGEAPAALGGADADAHGNDGCKHRKEQHETAGPLLQILERRKRRLHNGADNPRRVLGELRLLTNFVAGSGKRQRKPHDQESKRRKDIRRGPPTAGNQHDEHASHDLHHNKRRNEVATRNEHGEHARPDLGPSRNRAAGGIGDARHATQEGKRGGVVGGVVDGAVKPEDTLDGARLQKELDGLKQEEADMESSDVNEAIDYEQVAQRKTRIAKLEAELPAKQAAASEIKVTMDDVAKVIELWTGIPAVKIQETEFVKLAGLEAELKKKIIGQDEAVHLVAQAVKRSRADLSGRRRPASFIFVGPTGVGKTELVKQLANQLFDGPDPLIRLDMSEYMEKYAVSRMIGSPPGYVGYEEAGQLTEKVRRRPYSVVLFDEIEKAHPDVMNILLQILDEGKINDAQGRTVDFSNTVICMTSNAGSSDKTTSGLGFNKSEEQLSEEKTRKALSQFLRPEFLGRVDEVIAFKPLSQQTLEGIAALMLDEYKPSMEAKGIAYSYTPAALSALVAKSQGGKFGARDLRRVIRKAVEDPAAERIIDGTLKAGGSLTVDAENGEVILK